MGLVNVNSVHILSEFYSYLTFGTATRKSDDMNHTIFASNLRM